MPSIVRKIVSPFIYSLCLPVIAIILLNLIEGLPYITIWRTGDLGAVIYLITLGSFILFLANKLITKFEKQTEYYVVDHIRQSIIYYIIFIVGGVKYLSWIAKYPISTCETDCFGYGIMLLPVLISFLAIVINGFYLYSRKVNKTRG